jgi:hypothetical protein
MKDCLSCRAYIATNDGGYISASDLEDDLVVAANLLVDSEEDTVGVLPPCPPRDTPKVVSL